MENKRVLVSGAASGIGASVAHRFAKEGWDVCLTDINEENLMKVFNQLPTSNHIACAGDYTEKKTIDLLSEKIQRNWGNLTALVNCAGVFMTADTITSPLDEWRKPFDIMINGAVNLTRLAVPFMKNGGRIVHITSIHSGRAEKDGSAYAMAKSALEQYCRGLAVELADQDILVNAIAPGFVDTPMGIVSDINVVDTPWFKDNYVNGHHLPLRRAGQPDEIAGVAWFLSGSDSSYITGQVITVDGGLTITF